MKKIVLYCLVLLVWTTTSCSHISNSTSGRSQQGSNKKEIRESKLAILKSMEKVADWQISNFTYREKGNLHDYGIDAWTNGVLYLGVSEFAKIANKDYYKWLRNIGDTNDWQIPANFKNHKGYSLYHADELCVAQFYIEMYRKYNDKKMISSTKERLDWIMANPPGAKMSYRGKQSWTWCDALFMAPPVYANIAEIEENPQYLTYMNDEFLKTYNHLYKMEEKLFFRDDSYFDKREANGAEVFWGRGNGWVVAGIANLLKVFPSDYPHKEFYVTLYQDMIGRLVELRDKDGFWHASLLDPDSYPSPETSATAMIVYAIGYGVNNGYLDKDISTPIAKESWKALESVVNADGKLGYVQPIGADPKKVTEDMTAVYGVGAFLMAGCEMYKMEQ